MRAFGALRLGSDPSRKIFNKGGVMSWGGGYDIANATIKAIEVTSLNHAEKLKFYADFIQALLDHDFCPNWDDITHSRAFLEAARIISIENAFDYDEEDKQDLIEYWNDLLKIE